MLYGILCHQLNQHWIILARMVKWMKWVSECDENIFRLGRAWSWSRTAGDDVSHVCKIATSLHTVMKAGEGTLHPTPLRSCGVVTSWWPTGPGREVEWRSAVMSTGLTRKRADRRGKKKTLRKDRENTGANRAATQDEALHHCVHGDEHLRQCNIEQRKREFLPSTPPKINK